MLAQGSTSQFRLKDGSQVLLVNPSDEAAKTSWIIPMGGLADLGYTLEWKGNQCRLCDDSGVNVKITVRNGCPMVPHEEGVKILKRLEEVHMHHFKKLLMVKAMLHDSNLLTGQSLDLETALTFKLCSLFPGLPPEIASRVVPHVDVLESETLGAQLPWNRRKRRRVERAQHLVLHLFSGPTQKFWERKLTTSTTEVLCIDLEGDVQADLMDPKVYAYVLRLAASGRVRCVMGGPPCRTVSALRYQQDDGPKVLRTEDYPYGVPNLSPADAEKVQQDVLLWFRFLLVYVLAEEVREDFEPQTDFILEQPQDPCEYRSQEDIEKYQYMSAFRTAEWKIFQERYHIQMISFDQGPMGHSRRKPTSLAINNSALLQLDELRGEPAVATQDEPPFQSMSMQQRCATSKTWSSWAPGLKEALAVAVKQRLEQEWLEPSSPRSKRDHRSGPSLKPLGAAALEQWKRHYENDHLPARRDCKHCLRAAGRSRPRKRIRHAESFTLSVDLSGRLTQGEDQSGKTAKYFMVAVYTFPVAGNGEPLLSPPEGQEPVDQPLPPPEAEVQDEMDPAVRASQVDDDFLAEGLQPLDGDGAPLPNEEPDADPMPATESKEEACAKSAYDAWHRLVEETTDVGVTNLTFIETLPSRNARDVLPALARIHCRLRALRLPLLRLRTDRARELIAAPIRQWTMARGILPTMTSGDSYKGNGRAEAEVNATKKAVRAVMDLGCCDLKYWPLIARHVGERRLRRQLSKVGWHVAPLLRFGTKAYAIRKRWKERYQDWRRVREEVQIMGPDIYASMTTPSYYVQSLEDNKFFFTDDVVVPQHEAPVDARDDPVLYLSERGENPAPVDWHHEPNRRIRGKQTVPMISMCHIEGEELVTQRFPMLFEPSDGIPPTKAQAGR